MHSFETLGVILAKNQNMIKYRKIQQDLQRIKLLY